MTETAGAAQTAVLVLSKKELTSVIDEAVHEVLSQLKPEDVARLRQQHANDPELMFVDCSLSYQQACQLGDASRVRDLLQDGSDPRESFPDGEIATYLNLPLPCEHIVFFLGQRMI